jgi:hypothetical protein
VDVVDGANEKINSGIIGKGFDDGTIRWAYPFPFKSDEDLDLSCVLGTETNTLGEIELVPWEQECYCVASFNLLVASVHGQTKIACCRNKRCRGKNIIAREITHFFGI